MKFYVARIKICDNKKQKYISKQIFYAFDKIAYNSIVKFFLIIKANSYVD